MTTVRESRALAAAGAAVALAGGACRREKREAPEPAPPGAAVLAAKRAGAKVRAFRVWRRHHLGPDPAQEIRPWPLPPDAGSPGACCLAYYGSGGRIEHGECYRADGSKRLDVTREYNARGRLAHLTYWHYARDGKAALESEQVLFHDSTGRLLRREVYRRGTLVNLHRD